MCSHRFSGGSPKLGGRAGGAIVDEGFGSKCARADIFFQAENDYDLSPSKVLSAVMKDARKPYEVKIYPPYGNSTQDGHAFGYFGSAVWADDVFRFLDQDCAKK